MDTYYKYPRTHHVPWSPGFTSDDKVLDSVDNFIGKRVIITEKLDGENTTFAYNRLYARSIDSKDDESKHWIKNNYYWVCNVIERTQRICGENVYAKHSIKYFNLENYFYGFSVWNNETCLSWEATVNILKHYGMIHVPVIYDGIWDEKFCRNIKIADTDKGQMEGYVVRIADSFTLSEFKSSIAKFVRKNHVDTDKHWKYSKLIPNELKR